MARKTNRTATPSSRSSSARRSSRSSAADRELLGAARAALGRAHSPYSRVRVGAALRAADGQVFSGCNVENASYGLTCCAERTALFTAVAAGVKEFEAIAIATSLPRALPPCGACRQVLHEFAPRLLVIYAGARGRSRSARLDALLPQAFGPEDLR